MPRTEIPLPAWQAQKIRSEAQRLRMGYTTLLRFIVSTWLDTRKPLPEVVYHLPQSLERGLLILDKEPYEELKRAAVGYSSLSALVRAIVANWAGPDPLSQVAQSYGFGSIEELLRGLLSGTSLALPLSPGEAVLAERLRVLGEGLASSDPELAGLLGKLAERLPRALLWQVDPPLAKL